MEPLKKAKFANKFSEYVNSKLNTPNKADPFKGQFSKRPSNNQFPQSSVTIRLQSPPAKRQYGQNTKENFLDFSNSKHVSVSRKIKSNQHNQQDNQISKQRAIKRMEQNKCGICLNQIQSKAHLACKHEFCYQCIIEWFKSTNKCPYCRQTIDSLWHKGQRQIVQPPAQQYQQSEIMDSQNDSLDFVCYNCDQTQEGDIILICDSCQVNGCHIQCDQSLRGRAPRGDWLCHFCR